MCAWCIYEVCSYDGMCAVSILCMYTKTNKFLDWGESTPLSTSSMWDVITDNVLHMLTECERRDHYSLIQGAPIDPTNQLLVQHVFCKGFNADDRLENRVHITRITKVGKSGWGKKPTT